MIDILFIYFSSFIIVFISGLFTIKYLGDNNKPLINLLYIPLIGLALIGIILQWIHLFFPLGNNLIFFGYIPFLFGFIILFKTKYNYHKFHIYSIFFILFLSIIILLPFFQIGYPSSFGITNNDAYWYTLADYRVSIHSFLDSSYDENSQLISLSINQVQRYGLNYLSLLIQSITSYKSWEVIHILGGLGVVLFTFSFLILGRELKISFKYLMILGFLIPISGFISRLYYDAFLATFFGFALLTSVLTYYTSLILDKNWNIKRTVLLSILTSGLFVYYQDIFLIYIASIGIISISTIYYKKLKIKQLKYILLYVITTHILAFPIMLIIYKKIFFISNLPAHFGYFHLDQILNTFIHLSGFSTFYEYYGNNVQIFMLIPAIIFLLLAFYGIYKNKSNNIQKNLILPLLVLFIFLFFYLLLFKHQEYSAHRVWMYVHSLLIVLLFIGIQNLSKFRLLFLSIISISILFIYGKEIFLKPNSTIIKVTEQESSLITFSKKYLENSEDKLLINFDPNTHIFYGHYVYYELVKELKQLRKKNVILNFNQYTYLKQNAEIDDFIKYKYILYLKEQYNEILAKTNDIIFENERYVIVKNLHKLNSIEFHSGFYSLEKHNDFYWRWMNTNGKFIIKSHKDINMLFKAIVLKSPGQNNIDISILLNNNKIFECKSLVQCDINLTLAFKEGSNIMIIKSNNNSKAPGNGDLRKMSVMLKNYSFNEKNE